MYGELNTSCSAGVSCLVHAARRINGSHCNNTSLTSWSATALNNGRVIAAPFFHFNLSNFLIVSGVGIQKVPVN